VWRRRRQSTCTPAASGLTQIGYSGKQSSGNAAERNSSPENRAKSVNYDRGLRFGAEGHN
jgi:hypothetical protein